MTGEQIIRINVGKGYDVHIGSGLLNRCGETIKAAVGSCRTAVITDTNVSPLYLNKVKLSLDSAGLDAVCYSFEAGESSKNLGTLSDILEFLAENQLTRSDCVVALGGGVVGDISGFAAGCYMRGIRFVQLPTTLLAAVDSSVGGKTAVDLKSGKNLAGLFLQPETVICDIECLSTLDKDNFACGMAEAAKTGILNGESLFSCFESGDSASKLTEIIAQCVAFKGKIVEADEHENGIRKTLNLGHTVGHAIEKCSDFKILHGQAVAVGTAIMSRAAKRLWNSRDCDRIINVLKRCGLPTETQFSAHELAYAALSDKKRSGSSITIVVPEKIGHCALKTISVNELEEVISAGLQTNI